MSDRIAVVMQLAILDAFVWAMHTDEDDDADACDDSPPCIVCGRPNHDLYMLIDNVWSTAGFEADDQSHVACVETRLGRRLSLQDFSDAPVNDVIRFGASMSDKS